MQSAKSSKSVRRKMPGMERNEFRRLTGTLILLLPVLSCCLSIRSRQVSAATQDTPNPDLICRNCHQQIYDRYEQTPMARASGNAADGLLPGEFLHALSGIEYRLFLSNGHAWLSYDRADSSPDRSLHGQQELIYYIGSGNRGRTYLFQRDGFWFESPVNWYSKSRLWDMNPKSLNAKEMPFTLPVDSTCVHCHTSGGRPSLPGSRNHFAGPPFLYGGITCEACHGNPEEHLARKGHGPILNPATLSGSRRVSVCLQCHLEGEIAVNQLGRSLQMFQPGDDLSEDVRFFVHEGEVGAHGRATSQWEALLQSACYRKSEGRLSCITCHDPHEVPAPEERVAYYRSKCLTCHADAGFIARHHPEKQDCSACHMAREKTEDVAHEQVTDHFIQERPSKWERDEASHQEILMAVGGEQASARDLGLAYAQLAVRGDANAAVEAQRLLKDAENEEQKRAIPARDADLHTELGFLDLNAGDTSAAVQEYESALAADPHNSVAAGDLAVLNARSHHLEEAVRLWRSVAEDDPGETAAGFDLAVGACMIGDSGSAIQALERVVEFSPDNLKARQLLSQLKGRPQACGSPH
jgi:hypothetical protein